MLNVRTVSFFPETQRGKSHNNTCSCSNNNHISTRTKESVRASQLGVNSLSLLSFPSSHAGLHLVCFFSHNVISPLLPLFASELEIINV